MNWTLDSKSHIHPVQTGSLIMQSKNENEKHFLKYGNNDNIFQVDKFT